jgi:four helix bundle protein
VGREGKVESRESRVAVQGIALLWYGWRAFALLRLKKPNILFPMGDYRELSVWKRAHALALGIYRSTQSFPDRERYGLVAQLRRAAVSMVSNIAEGTGRQSDRELARFLRIARGSACEVECQLLLSRDLGFLKPGTWMALDADCREISRMLNGLIRSFRTENKTRGW